VKRLIAAAVASVVWAGVASAEPANGAGLKYLGPTERGAIYLSDVPGARTGQVVEFWTLSVFAEAPLVGGVPVSAVWLSQKVDCAARTMASGDAVVLNDKLAVIARKPSTDPAAAIAAGTPGDRLRGHFCDGASLAGVAGVAVASVADAVRQTRAGGPATAN
jgi:hypothetical protein